jgi:hypothetical protein
MIKWCQTSTVRAPATLAFDVVGTNVAVNHPKWEREVREVRLLTPGSIGVGTRAVMVRKDMGRLREVDYEVVEFEPGRRIAFSHPDDLMDFALSYEVDPLSGHTCRLTIDVTAAPKGPVRIIEPLMRVAFARRSQRITAALINLIEEQAAATHC